MSLRSLLYCSCALSGNALRYGSHASTVVQLPDRLGAGYALSWCEGGLATALPKAVDFLLSQRIPLPAAEMLKRKFREHFEETGELVVAPDLWSRLECYRDEESVPHAVTHPDWPFVDDPEAGVPSFSGNSVPQDAYCEMLYGHNATAGWGGELFQGRRVGDIIHESLIPPDLRGVLHPQNWRIETVLATAKIVPLMLQLVRFRPKQTLRERMTAATAGICRFSDVEAVVPGLARDTPFTCSVVDLVLSTFMCSGTANAPRQSLACPRDPPSVAHIKEFPADFCYVPKASLQRQTSYGASYKAFSWEDPDLTITLDLHDLRPLPPFVSRRVRNAELLTYLTLFRACMMIYRLIETLICFKDPPPLELIPGWRLRHVIHVELPRDSRTIGYLQERTLPLMFVSQMDENPCHVAVGVRGTASKLEWLLDFNYWASPVPGSPRTGAAHNGFQDFINTAGIAVRAYLERNSEIHNCNCNNTRITIFGHSLGGGVGQILALQLASLYTDRKGCDVIVDGVFFASPRVLAGEAREDYRQRVNGRHLIDLSDPLYHLPCHAENSRLGYARCGTGHVNLPGAGRDEYGENYGRILLDVDFIRRGSDVNVQHHWPSGTDSPDEQMSQDMSDMKFLKGGNVVGGPPGADPRDGARESGEELERLSEQVEYLFLRSQFLASQHGPRRGDQLVESLIQGSGLSNLTTSLIQTAISLMVPNGVLRNMPTKNEIAAAHMASLACALSVACHGMPWSSFRWWCEGLPQGVLDF